MSSERFAIAVHGGAGDPARRDPEHETRSSAALVAALEAGAARLEAGGSALDAVEAAVCVLEDCPDLNAGRGSALTATGDVEMDASIAEGTHGRIGAVALVRRTRHPISLARAVLEGSPHVMLAGEAADRFAADRGLEQCEPGWLVTDARRAQLERVRARATRELDHGGAALAEDGAGDARGTVGAVARDARGALAAATSTGGLVNKWPGRIGDSPVPGAGTWADDATCAVSATGHGELFLRTAFAHEVAAAMRHAGRGLERACQDALAQVRALGGSGGCIAIEARGEIALPFVSAIMLRGALRAGEPPRVAIGREPLRAADA